METPANADPVPFDDEPVLAKRPHDRRQQPVLAFEDPFRQRLRIVAIAHVDPCLRDDRSMIDFGGDEMDGAAMDARAVVERTAMRIEPRIGR